ncbi:MAG: carbon starvation protein A [Ottowia sp.]|nr:carbon starvation protein A [Ottowia sp.]
MITFLIALLALIVGYAVYGRFVESIFAPDGRLTPAQATPDGVDYIPMKTWRATLIQLLNIAGLGPIFGALAGACFGPIVFFWIVLGTLLGGAVHDYMSGMISGRNRGESLANLSGRYLGKPGLYGMRVFSTVLLVLVGVTFTAAPAGLLAKLSADSFGMPQLTTNFWIVVVLCYYVLATLLPIDKVIGRFYPIFGILLGLMAFGIMLAMLFTPSLRANMPEMQLANLHPKNLPVWPYMFIVVACGAISGFHATQSPMMAKCMVGEREGRKIFYGAMVLEGFIALVWAAAGTAFYGGVDNIGALAAAAGKPAVAVYDISTSTLGAIGGAMAVIGVIVCPITSGDTSFRTVRLILAEWLGLEQKSFSKRLIITIPLMLVGAALTQIDFNILWRYFAWSNQTLAMLALWVATVYLMRHETKRFSSLVTALPATFMTAVTTTYIMMAKEGFQMSASVAYPAGILIAVAVFAWYLVTAMKTKSVGAPPPVTAAA